MKPTNLAVAVVCFSTSIAAQEFAQPQPARQVTVRTIPGVVAAAAQWTQAWAGRDNADGIVGTPDGGLLFAQEQPKRVSKIDADNRVSVYMEDTNGAGSLALDARGRLYAVQRTCTDPGLRLASPCTEPTNVSIIHPPDERKLLADNIQGKPLGRINDLVVDRSGGAYFTSGGAFYVSARGEVIPVGQNLRTNGIMLSPDEKTLSVTNGQTIVAFDIGANGAVSNQRDFAKLETGGSGGVDAEGREMLTEAGVRNNAKSIFWIPTIAEGFTGRAK